MLSVVKVDRKRQHLHSLPPGFQENPRHKNANNSSKITHYLKGYVHPGFTKISPHIEFKDSVVQTPFRRSCHTKGSGSHMMAVMLVAMKRSRFKSQPPGFPNIPPNDSNNNSKTKHSLEPPVVKSSKTKAEGKTKKGWTEGPKYFSTSLKNAVTHSSKYIGTGLKDAVTHGSTYIGSSLKDAITLDPKYIGDSLKDAVTKGPAYIGSSLKGAVTHGSKYVGSSLKGAVKHGPKLIGTGLKGARKIGKKTDRLYASLVKEHPANGPVSTDAPVHFRPSTHTEEVAGEMAVIHHMELTETDNDDWEYGFDERLTPANYEETVVFYNHVIDNRLELFKALYVLGDMLVMGELEGDKDDWEQYTEQAFQEVKTWREKCLASHALFEKSPETRTPHLLTRVKHKAVLFFKETCPCLFKEYRTERS